MSAGMSGEALGRTLVALQFVLMAVIAAFAASVFLRGAAPVVAWGVLAAGVALGGWALSANRPGNFNIRPTPKAGARLVQSGPYRWIRHPMYSAILVAGLAGLLGVDPAGRPAVGAAWLALLAVLWLKSGLEERWMAARHADYAAYRRATRRFVPGLF
jgi:protein-S-isoprenylcysteine O-methyltransferase Ste14